MVEIVLTEVGWMIRNDRLALSGVPDKVLPHAITCEELSKETEGREFLFLIERDGIRANIAVFKPHETLRNVWVIPGCKDKAVWQDSITSHLLLFCALAYQF